MAEAADVLRKLLAAESEAVRLGAACSMIDLTIELRECVAIEEEIAELRAAVDALQAGRLGRSESQEQGAA